MSKKKDILFLLFFLIGFILLLYPLFADYMLQLAQKPDIEIYEKTSEIPDDRKKEMQQWNDMLGKVDTIERQSNFNNSQTVIPNIFAMIEIPKIKLKAPIYYSTSDLVLSKGVGILEGTDLPTGGEGKHSVLSAHRGLSLGNMFTDLPKIKKGDLFYIDVFGETLAYEVDQIKTVLPDNIKNFETKIDHDYVTLLTCTPIGINSHRLLVRGHRVPYSQTSRNSEKPYFWTFTNILWVILITLLVIIISMILINKGRNKRKIKQKKISSKNRKNISKKRKTE